MQYTWPKKYLDLPMLLINIILLINIFVEKNISTAVSLMVATNLKNHKTEKPRVLKQTNHL